jgi:hypothetical protein
VFVKASRAKDEKAQQDGERFEAELRELRARNEELHQRMTVGESHVESCASLVYALLITLRYADLALGGRDVQRSVSELSGKAVS